MFLSIMLDEVWNKTSLKSLVVFLPLRIGQSASTNSQGFPMTAKEI